MEKCLRLKIQHAVFCQNHRIGFRRNFQVFLKVDPGFGLQSYKSETLLRVVADDETDAPIAEVAEPSKRITGWEIRESDPVVSETDGLDSIIIFDIQPLQGW